jgi:hypothetical protein
MPSPRVARPTVATSDPRQLGATLGPGTEIARGPHTCRSDGHWRRASRKERRGPGFSDPLSVEREGGIGDGEALGRQSQEHGTPLDLRGLLHRGWLRVFDQALREFNTLSRTHGLGATLTRSATPPATSGSGGADVAVRMANGPIPFTCEGSSWSGGRREVSAPVKPVIAVHEPVHACGLENPGHCPAGLFRPRPEVEDGTTPAGDRARITYSLRSPRSASPK